MDKLKGLFKILVIIGAINWGLVGAFQMDLVAMLLGDMTMAAKIVYILVGIGGLMGAWCMVKCCGSSSCEK